MSTGRVRNINVGVVGIERLRREDDVHLPTKATKQVSYLPETRALDAILAPPTLDARLTDIIVPTEVGRDLLEAGAMSRARQSLGEKFAAKLAAEPPLPGANLPKAQALLAHHSQLDDEIREALAALLRA